MNSLLIALNAIIPIFLPIVVGVLIRQLHWITDNGVKDINRISFHVLMPCLLFINIYSADFQIQGLNRLVWFCILAIAGEIAFGIIVAKALDKDIRRQSVIVQTMFRVNLVAMGLPLIQHIADEDGSIKMAILITILVPAFNIISVFLLEGYGNKDSSLGKLLFTVIKNPLIIGAMIAGALRIAGLRFPSVIAGVISDFAKTASVLALILLGTSLQFDAIKRDRAIITWCVTIKNLVLPVLLLVVAYFLSFRDSDLACIMILGGCPVATNVYTMTDQMGGDSTLAGELVAFTSLISCLSLFVLIFLTKQFELIG